MTPQERKVMELALEALDMMVVPRGFQAQVRIKEIYEAIKQTIAQQQCYCGDITRLGVVHRADSFCDEKPEQEPVGWLDSNDKLAEFMHKDLKAEHDKRASSTPRAFQIPVYTTPPQRKPLTDEKISLIAHNIDSGDWNDLNFKECWHEGFKAGFREAEIEHNIKE